jgi:amino acid adenylation domain-containing protein
MTLTPSVTSAERLLKLARAARLQRSSVTAPIEPAERGERLPLSFAQQRLWFLEQLGGLGDTYHVPTQLRLGEKLDRAALRRALDAMLARHEALRTTFVEVEGEPVQRIVPVEESRFHLLEHDLGEHPNAAAELRRLAAEEEGAPFDLEHGPLIRGRLVRLAADEHVLLMTMHHIVSDAWSMGVLTRELGTLYDAFRRGDPDPLPPLPIQYADYAIWQRKWVDGEVLRQQAEYWKATLSGVPELLELPTDHPRPPRQSHAGATVGIDLGEPLTAGLKALGQRRGTTLFMTVLAGWAAVLARLSGQRDVVVGTPSANRGRAEIEGLIGFFINTLALRVDLSGSPTVAELLEQVRTRSLGAQQNQDIPFEQVVELAQPARSLAHTPLFQVMFAWQGAAEGGPELPAPRAGGVGAASPATAKFDLSLALGEAGGRIVGSLTYATSLFEQSTIERHLAYLRRALEQMVADDAQAVARLELLSEAERRRVVEEWNATDAAYPRESCIHELFEAQVERAPDAVAVVFGEAALTYAELNTRANRLAHHLIERGVGPDARVAICVERGVEMMVGLLAIMKAGGAYVPLDPAYPAERLFGMLADSAPVVLLTQGSLAGVFHGTDVRVIDLAADAGTWAGRPETNPGRAGIGLTPDHLAYVIYTSGSTGMPKGVMVEHRSLSNLVAWHCAAFGVKAGDRSSSVAGFGFDATTWEVWPPLCAGAALVLPATRDPQALLEWWEEQRLDVSFLPTPLAEVAFARGRASAGLRTLLIGGDRLGSIPAEPLPFALVNNYGPTETTVVATSGEIGASAKVHIGRPIANTRVYLLDGAGEPVPEGVAGELYVGGAGVARGYQHRPGLTAERFVPDPFGGEPGARMYRTGDLGRWREESALMRECVSAEVDPEVTNSRTDALTHSRTAVIEFLGRTDFQVKVRGFRIELGEIEARLSAHPAVRDAVVLAREDASGDRRLVAYYVGEALDVETLRAHLSERLPGYMVPAAYVWMEAYPLTPNGKVDRKALPAPEGDAYARRGYEAPVGETEAALAEIWSGLLKVEQVGRRDSFFELGGHSLLAVQVISRVRQRLGAEVGIADLFECPALADLARAIDDAARAGLPAIEPVERGADLPLSFAQQRLWFIERLESAGAVYHIPVRQRLRGELDRDALVRALDRMVERHEALRTTFPEVDGAPVQRIAPAEESPFHLAEHDLRGQADGGTELRRLVAEEAGAPFDLARGPLIRGRLVRIGDEDHVLLITMHHIVSDGWSMGVFTRELGALYGAFRAGRPDPLPPLAVQYADFAAWQRRWMEGEVLREQAEYWRTTLSGAPELLELPTDHARPARQDFTGATVGLVLDEALSAALKELSRRHGTTLYMTLLAGWAAVLARLSGQDDVVVGTPTANRGREEIEGLIGFFVNMLPVRVELSDAPTVAALLARVRERALGAQHHQDFPFEQVVELVRPTRSLAHAPLFQAMFTWQNAPGAAGGLPGLAPAPVGPAGPSGDAAAGASADPAAGSSAEAAASARATANVDLSLMLWEQGGRIAGSVTYAAALFERETVSRYAGYLRRMLEGMVADESRPVERLALMPADERRLVVEEWNRTAADFPREACLHALFEEQVRRTPGAAAVVFEGEELTYAELNARANRLAHHLQSLGVGPDARVALCLERGVDAVAGLLAVLKAGGAYVPLDPSYPVERLREMLADSRPLALLTQASLRERVASLGVPALALDADAGAWAECAEENPARLGLTPENLAYVIYTSGSTGRPKGVMVRHGSVVNLFSALQARIYADHSAPLRVGVNAPFVFDGSVKQIVQLLGGHALCPVPEAVRRDPAALVAWIERERVDAVDMTPSLLRLALAEGLGQGAFPRFVLVGGEAVNEELRERMSRVSTRFYNVYGPTECTVDVTAREVAATGPAAAIGGPLPNVATYVLDPALLPVPVGVAGELYVGGAGVARGYLDRPAMTAERFVPDPFGTEPGARLYRTGDRVRWREESALVRECVSAEVDPEVMDSRTDALTHSRTAFLEYLGRLDVQVKVRGFRIELGEIEARLAGHAAVRDAVVLAREDAPGDRRLVAYCVGDEGLDVESLRAHLAERLPSYMVPAAFVRLDAFPVTASGKVNRRALPAPEGDAFATRGYEAPLDETEQALAEVWAEVLRVERVGRHDNFFELGGHSLLAVQVISRVRKALAVEVALGELFLHPVLKDFARGLATAARSELPPIQPAPRDGRLPLSFAQQRLWFLEQLGDLGSTYHIPTRLHLRGELHRAALVGALDTIVARHEALRTVFAVVDGVPEQRIAPADTGFRLVEHDLGGRADARAELGRVMSDEAHARFDLERGPLIRGRLVRLAADDHVLLLTMHHIVSDGWSMGVLTRELSALYAAFRRGEPDPLPPLPIQYADYAAWQRRWVEGEVLREQAEYWTETLAGAPELLELPTDHPRPAEQDHAGALVGIDLGEALTAGLKALCRRHGATPFMTLLAGWAAVLARLSGQRDVVVGTPSANRGRAEIEGLIGFFVNTLALRVDLSGSPTVAELLEQVRTRSLGAQHHQDIPFEQVVDLVQPTRSLAHTPLFQVMFAWQNATEGGPELPGLRLGGVGAASPSPAQAQAQAQVTAKFDLSLALGEAGGRIVGSLTYATSLFERETVERWVAYLRRVLEGMVADETRRVDRLALLPAAERRLVVEEWNATEAEYPSRSCVHARFEEQVERTPGAVAVVHESESLTYAELNARANRLAHHLIERGAGPDARVAILVPRSIELVVCELAILKAGAAYVPIDPSFPAERIAFMVADSGSALVLSRTGADLPLLAGVERVDVDALPEGARHDPRVPLHSGAAAYVMYTSGSTGAPKGVVVPHRAIVRLVMNNGYADFGPDDRVAFAANPAFDASTLEVWAPLLNGGRIVVIGQDVLLDPRRFAGALARHEVDVLWMSVGLFNQYVEELKAEIPRLRYLIVGGDALDPQTIARVLKGHAPRNLLNGYGPTETTTFAITHAVTGVDEGARSIPLGRPIANTRIYILDAHGEPVPVGVAGEMYIGGDGVALGYLGRPGLTAERFVPDPFSAEPGARMYRTGDVGRWRKESALVRECVSAEVDPEVTNSRTDALTHSRTAVIEFLGRTDFQVKVRGFRIELGEIEARLAAHPAVRDAVVLAREDAPGDKRLVAYYVGEALDVETLRAHLSERLPEYMVPAAYMRLEALPLTPNGKVDRKALTAPEGDAFATRQYEAPVGEVEEALASIWAELLGVERVGRRDNFFELGGHSLLAVRVISRIRQVLETEVVLAHVFSHPTVESLAARLTGADDGHRSDRAIAIRPTGSRPPLFLAYEGTGSIAYAQVLHPHVDPEIPVYALPVSPADAPLRTVEGMATRLVRMIREVQPSGPYRVAGWSFGGVLAYEVAAQLIGRDETVEFVGMFDSYHPARARAVSHDVAQEHALVLHALRAADTTADGWGAQSEEEIAAAGDEDLETFVRTCREDGLLPRHVTVAQARAVRDRLRGHVAALREYAPQPLPGAVHLFPARQSADPDLSRGWQSTLPAAQLRVTPVPGTHLSMMRPPNAATLGEALSRALDRAREEAAPRAAGGGSPVVTLQGGGRGAEG